MPLRGALRYSQRSGHLQTRFAQTMQVPSSERCSVAQHGLMAVLNTSRLVRFANFARRACSLRSPRGGWGFLIPQASLLARARHAVPLHQTPSPLTPHPSLLTPHSSLLTPHSSLLTPHSSLLTPHSSLLTPHSSLLTPHSSLLTPHSSLLTPHSSLLTPHSSLLTPHSSPLTLAVLTQPEHRTVGIKICLCIAWPPAGYAQHG